MIRENVPLAPYTTFQVGGPARFFAVAETEQDVAEAAIWAEERGLPLFVLGGGSNLLVSDHGFAGLVLHIGIKGIEDRGDGLLDVAAGEVWDEFVQRAVDAELAGIECLAGIPGSVGGTPVQNVGAYGQEVADTIVSVRALDRKEKHFIELDREACRFRYRASLFNADEPGRYIVTRVSFRLNPKGLPQVTYADLKRFFAESPEPVDLARVSSATRVIRRRKGMFLVAGDPDCRSAGSFFKNPVVGAAVLADIAHGRGLDQTGIPHWPAGEGRVKLSAAWLIEQAGFHKGYGAGPVGISSRHTLALVNRGGATYADVERMQRKVVEGVAARFGVELQREPVLLE